MSGIVIVGAGQAGASLAARLRQQGYDRPVTLIGEEPVAPYQRPPLSKGYLMGEMPLDRLFLRADSFYAENGITLMTGARVDEIDTARREIAVGGDRLGYEMLALTTGSVPRRLPSSIGGDLGGVYTVRTLADIDAMRPEFRAGARVLIVGGGYIGLEAAAVAAKLGLDVTLIEAARRILGRVAASETSDYIRGAHLAHGVRIYEGVGLDRLIGGERVERARLGDGREIAVDFVIVGVGIQPATSLAEGAGLQTENGIRADEFGRTSDASVWTAGDCASFPQGDGRLRLESVGNAIDMAECTADNMLGHGRAYVAQPWFWSDQYDIKLQIAGLGQGYDHIVTRTGEGEARSFWYFAGERLLAVDAMNDPRAYMIGKRLIEMGKSPAPAEIEDPATDLKGLLRR